MSTLGLLLIWIPVVLLAVIAVVAAIRDYREESRSDFR